MKTISPKNRYYQGGERSVRERLAPIYKALSEDGDDWEFQYYLSDYFNDYNMLKRLPTTHKECSRFRIVWRPRRDEKREETLAAELDRLYKQNRYYRVRLVNNKMENRYMRETLVFCKERLPELVNILGPQITIDELAYRIDKALGEE